MRRILRLFLAVLLGVGLLSVLALAQSVNVTTWHNDNERTGQNTNETTLTTGINTNNLANCANPARWAALVETQTLLVGGNSGRSVGCQRLNL